MNNLNAGTQGLMQGMGFNGPDLYLSSWNQAVNNWRQQMQANNYSYNWYPQQPAPAAPAAPAAQPPQSQGSRMQLAKMILDNDAKMQLAKMMQDNPLIGGFAQKFRPI